MRPRSLIFLPVLAAALVAVGLAGATGSASDASPSRFIVQFDGSGDGHAAIARHGGRLVRDLGLIDGAVVTLPAGAAAALERASGVASVEADAVVFALKPPGACEPWPGCKDGDDGGGDEEPPAPPPQTLDWGVDRIDADLAWSASRGAGVKVAIIDTGIDKDHADLVANLKGGVNFVAPTSGPPWARVADPSKWNDDNGHGTHVAGSVAAADNDQGVVGVAPEAHLYAVKVLDGGGSGYVSDIIAGIEWAVNNGMDVANMSLGTSSDVQALHDAVDAAEAAGLLLVAAAGNSGDGDPSTNDVNYPAKYSSVVAVAATASDDSSPYWSSEGAEVEVAAPGVSILSTWNDGAYHTISGTSMASPHAAGVAALLLATAVPASYDADLNGAWSPSEARAALTATADDLGAAGTDNVYGAGLVDAEEAATGAQTNP